MIEGKEYFVLNGEIATLVEGFDDYTITTSGKVYSNRFKRYLKMWNCTKGYPQTQLRMNKKKITLLVHRMVAQAFIPNPESKLFVDHINRIRNDFRISNLRWATVDENNNNRGFGTVHKQMLDYWFKF